MFNDKRGSTPSTRGGFWCGPETAGDVALAGFGFTDAADDPFSFNDIFVDTSVSTNSVADSLADTIDEFTSSLFSMPLPALPAPSTTSLFSVPNLQATQRKPALAIPRKPSLSKSSGTCSREYRRSVAIPRYLDKRTRRKWTHDLMHPSRSVAAHRRPRNGGKFDAVNAKFVCSTELGTL